MWAIFKSNQMDYFKLTRNNCLIPIIISWVDEWMNEWTNKCMTECHLWAECWNKLSLWLPLSYKPSWKTIHAVCICFLHLMQTVVCQHSHCMLTENFTRTKVLSLCLNVCVCVCVTLVSTLPLCQDPDVFTITPLRHWFCIKGCQDTASTGRTDTACSTGVNNIWDGKCPQREGRDKKKKGDRRKDRNRLIRLHAHAWMHSCLSFLM